MNNFENVPVTLHLRAHPSPPSAARREAREAESVWVSVLRRRGLTDQPNHKYTGSQPPNKGGICIPLHTCQEAGQQ